MFSSWATICRETGLSKGTAQRARHSLPKNHSGGFRILPVILVTKTLPKNV